MPRLHWGDVPGSPQLSRKAGRSVPCLEHHRNIVAGKGISCLCVQLGESARQRLSKDLVGVKEQVCREECCKRREQLARRP